MIDDSDEIVVRRVVQASQEVAFEAWTSPEHVEQWWSPTESAECTLCEIDFRVDGQYRLHLTDPENGKECEVEGVFHEITPPERLIYSWNARTHEGDVENTLVTVEFRKMSEDATEVIVRHRGLPDAPIRKGHEVTWKKMLASYANHLTSMVHETREDFRMSLVYAVPADQLFEQFASARGISHWWTEDCEMEPQAGGKASFRFGDSGFYAHVTVTEFDPPHLVAWKVDDARHPEEMGFSDLHDWNGTTIRYEIQPLGESRSQLNFTHRGLGPLECSVVCSSLWGYYLNESLRGYLERGTGNPSKLA